MDIFSDQYVEYPIGIIHIRTGSYAFILPDFSLTHIILSPDITIVRFNDEKNRAEVLKLAKEEELQVVMNLNNHSYRNSQSWIVSNSKHLLEFYGGVEK